MYSGTYLFGRKLPACDMFCRFIFYNIAVKVNSRNPRYTAFKKRAPFFCYNFVS